MKYSKLFTPLFIVLSFIFVSNIVFAVEPKVPESKNSIIVATVNIQNTKIISQEGNILKLSFDITNQTGIQDGVKYGIRLIGKNTKGQYIADEKVYGDALTLYENSSIHKEVTYEAPSNLTGEYTLLISSKNQSGFSFGSVSLGKITLTSSVFGLEILPESCSLSLLDDKSNKKYTLSQGVDIAGNETLVLSCEVKNSSTREITAIPNYETTLRNLYGEIVSAIGGETQSVLFKGTEKKTISLKLPKASLPQAYDIRISLKDGDKLSNFIIVHYVLRGNSGTLQNLSLDKDFYKAGDKAVLSFVWYSRADAFPGNRAKTSGLTENSIVAKIAESSGKLCGEIVERKVFNNYVDPKVEVPFVITSECFNPTATITLKDGSGNVLDEKTFSVETKSIDKKQTEAGKKSSLYIMLAALILVVLLGIAIYLKIKNKSNKNENLIIKVLFPFFILIVAGCVLPLRNISAYGFIVGSELGTHANVNVNISTGTVYNPGDTIKVTGEMEYVACENAISNASLSAYLDNSSPNTSKTIIEAQNMQGGSPANYGEASFTAPTQPGNYWLIFISKLNNQSASGYLSFTVSGDGICSTDVNHCSTSGSETWSSTTSSNSMQILWSCPGYGNGKTKTCSYDRPKVDGACTDTANAVGCKTGDKVRSPDGDNLKWSCVGTGGGSTASCSLSKVNSVCNKEHYKCDVGNSYRNNYYSFASRWNWNCSTGTDERECQEFGVKPECSLTDKNTCVQGTFDESKSHWEDNIQANWYCTGSVDSTYCSISKPVDGACSPDKLNGCVSSESAIIGGLKDDIYSWSCPGSGTGTSASCTLDTKQALYGTLSATPCVISKGEGKCTSTIEWSVYNSIGQSFIRKDGVAIKNGDSGSEELSLSYSWAPISITLNNGTTELANQNIYAQCSPGSSWNWNKNICENPTDGGWKYLSSCSVQCGGGTQDATCSDPVPSGGGKNCPGLTTLASPDKIFKLSCNKQACLTAGLVSITGEKTFLTNTNQTFNLRYTDPYKTKGVYFVIDFGNNSYKFIPEKSGTTINYYEDGGADFTYDKSFTNSWAKPGSYTFKVSAFSYDGSQSSSTSFTVYVTSLTDTYAALKVGDCDIEMGQATCPMSYSWQVFNPKTDAKYGVKYFNNDYFSTQSFLSVGEIGNNQNYLAKYGDHTFYVADNYSEISNKITATAKCIDGTKWNPSTPGFVVLPTQDICVSDPDDDDDDEIDTDSDDDNGDDGFYDATVSSTIDLFVKRNSTLMTLLEDKINNLLTTKDKIPYGAKATVEWKSSASSCKCEYKDSTKSNLTSCIGTPPTGSNGAYLTPALSRDTTYTISCKNESGSEISKSVKILVNKVNIDYIEQ